jgi:predicted  nucleic acid-binding Zn-ribbon protein
MTQTSPSSGLSSLDLEDQKITEEPSLLAHETQDVDDELSRLESLLSARTRSHGGLQRELERRDRLFREALVRISTSTSQEFSALRVGYDAAVARAIEAEVGRAELTFALDETRAQLTAALPSRGVGVQVQAPSVYAAGAERSEQVRALEQALTQAQAERDALRRGSEALRGELTGLRARLEETELAWLAAQAQAHKQGARVVAKEERIAELRAESAELTLLAQTRAARIAELSQAAASDQQEIRTLRAQMNAANAAQVAQSDARASDRQRWAEREQAALAAAEGRLREFLGTIEQPLRQLDASLDALNSAGPELSATETQVSAPAQAVGEQAEVRPSARRRS